MKKEYVEFDIQNSPVSGISYTSSLHSRPLLIFGTGLTSRVEHYENALLPLSDTFDIIALNNRGHAENKEKFDAKKLKHTLKALQENYIFPDYYVGHSVGCSMDSNIPTFMITPFLGNGFGSPMINATKVAGKILTTTGLNYPLEYLTSKNDFAVKQGFNNYHFIRDSTQLSKIVPPEMNNKKLAFLFSTHDNIVGTHNPDKMIELTLLMNQEYGSGDQLLKVKNYSYLGRGLNHNLNIKDMSRFLIPEPEHDESKVDLLTAITDFYFKN